MQSTQELEPTVRIRELKKDRVNFVLENVDLAYDHSSVPPCWLAHIGCYKLCKLFQKSDDGRYTYSR